MHRYPSDLRGQSAKLIFVGLNPTRCSKIKMTIFRYKKDNKLYKIYYGRFKKCTCCFSYKAEGLYHDNIIILKDNDLILFDEIAVGNNL